MLKRLLFASSFALLSVNAFSQIFQEDFESGTTLPAGWSQTSLATDGGYLIDNPDALSSQYFPIPQNDGNAIGTNDDACDCDKSVDVLTMPSVDLSGVTSVYLLFDLFYLNLSASGVQESFSLKASIDGGTTWTNVKNFEGVGAWHTEAIDISAFAGNADVKFAFTYNDGGGWLYGAIMDNFLITVPDTVLRASIGSAEAGRYVDAIPGLLGGYSKFWAGENLTIAGTIQNDGFVPITSFTATWTKGAQSVSQTYEGLNVVLGTSYEFSLDLPISLGANVGEYEVSISNVNGGDEDDASDNTTYVELDVEGVTPAEGRKVVIEEGTGTWCQWCPRGAVMMDFIAENYPETAVPIAVHNADPMKVTTYDTGMGGLISGYPSGLVDRTNGEVDPIDFERSLIERLSTPAPVSVQHNVAYDAATRVITVESQLQFVEEMNGNFRVAMVITEDDVTGITSTWRQSNAYSGGGNGPMGGYEDLPSLVPAAQMVYDHVGRAIVSSFTGAPNSVPAANPAGSTVTFTSTYTHPVAQEVDKMHAITMLINTTTGEIINAEQTAVPFTITATNEAPLAGIQVEIYPNPVAAQATVDLKLEKQSDVQMRLTDVNGKVVYQANFEKMTGDYKLPLRLQHLSTGTYMLTILADGQLITKPVMVAR